MALNVENIGEVDLLDVFHFDTFLSVKMDRKGGNGTLFVNYIIPIERKDGTRRNYGDVIFWFRKEPRFRFARGFILSETADKSLWMAEHQYLYFDRKRATFEDKKLEIFLYHQKVKKG